MPSRRPGPEDALLLLARLALAALFVPSGLGKLADLAGFAATFVVDRFTLFEHDGEIRWRPRTRFALGAA